MAQAVVGWSIILHLKSSSPLKSLTPPVLLCFLSATMTRSRCVLLSYLHLFFLCLLALPQPASVSEPVRSQTERVSRGLERGIISVLLPLSLPFSRSPSVYPPPLHLSLLHHLTSSSLRSQHMAQSPFTHLGFSAPSISLHADTHKNRDFFSVCVCAHIQNDMYTWMCMRVCLCVSTHLCVGNRESCS